MLDSDPEARDFLDIMPTTSHQVLMILFRDSWLELDTCKKIAIAFPELSHFYEDCDVRTSRELAKLDLGRRLARMRTVGVWHPERQITYMRHVEHMQLNGSLGAAIVTQGDYQQATMDQYTPLVRRISVITRSPPSTNLFMISINNIPLVYCECSIKDWSSESGISSFQIELPPVPILDNSALFLSVSSGFTWVQTETTARRAFMPDWNMMMTMRFGVTVWMEKKLVGYQYVPIKLQYTVFKHPIATPGGLPWGSTRCF